MSVFQEIDDEDVADRIEAMLPDFALEKVRRLEEISSERSGFYSSLLAKIVKLQGQRSEWQSLISRTELAIEREGMPKTTETVAQIAKWNRRITKTSEEIKKLSAQQKLEPTLPPHIVFEALQELPLGTKLVDARVSPKIGKSESIMEKISASRNSIGRLISQRGAIRNALLPKDIALHRATTDIKLEAAKAAPDFSPNARLVRPALTSRPRQGKTAWPTFVFDTGTKVVEVEDAAATLKYLMRDALIAAATESISKLYENNPLVIPEAEREARMAEIDAQILAEARVEEARIEIAEAKGLKVLRRKDAPPFAVLGVAVAPPECDFG